MSRAKHKVSKLIDPMNSAEENRRIAELGEFADGPEWELAFMWRYNAMWIAWQLKPVEEKNLTPMPRGTKRPPLAKIQKAEVAAARKHKRELDDEIGGTIRAAMLRGDWQFLQRLAEATKFVAEQQDWKANSIWEFSQLLGRWNARAVDPMRHTIAHEYFFHRGIVVDKAKRSRKAFIAYIAKKMRRAVDERGTFAKAFDRACNALGILWRGKVDNS